MTRFLKRVPSGNGCGGCALWNDQTCLKHYITPLIDIHNTCVAPNSIFTLVPRPPDGTRCRDLDGNIKVVRRDV
ncbi:MAG: hypothetical protein WC455_16720 [Dehalococcoidia bacterium]|jgi:hypothetical protein